MLDGNLRPRVRAALRVDPRAGGGAVTMGDSDLQFRGVPMALLKDLVARFDGHQTLTSICHHYPEPVTRVVHLVAKEMQARGMLLLSREHTAEWPHENALPRGAATWRYVRDRVADPLAAWQRWRRDPIAVYGHGVSFAAAVGGLLDAGVGRLWVDPGSTVDREAVAALLTKHARCDDDFQWRWLDARNDAEPISLIVHVADEPLSDLPDLFTESVGRRVLAVTTAQGGTVWCLAAGSLTPSSPTPISDHTLTRFGLSVLGSMAAFQALNMILVGEAFGEQTLLPLSSATSILPDGRFEVVTSNIPKPVTAGVFVRAASVGSVLPQQRERERWASALQPLMGGTSPLLVWDDTTPLSVFPLAHRAMTITSREGDKPIRSIMWAVLPKDVTARTLRHGIETLADRLHGGIGHAAAFDDEEWRTRAYLAWAQARAPTRLLEWPAWLLEYDATQDVEFRTLVRLVRLYLGEEPRVGLSLDPASGLPRADAAAGNFERFALGTSPLAAAIEALGALLSAYQIDASPLLATVPLVGTAMPCHLTLTETVQVYPERVGLVPRMLDTLNDITLHDLLIGRFEPDSSRG